MINKIIFTNEKTLNIESILLSTRVRFARNFEEFDFCQNLNIDKKLFISKKMQSICNLESLKYFYLKDMKNDYLHMLIENHIISPLLFKNKDFSAFATNEDYSVSVMINEEDHIRLQSITYNENIFEAYDLATKLLKNISNNIQYKFCNKFKYINYCKSNNGTGLRIQYRINLYALHKSGKINELKNYLKELGLQLRGDYGENSNPIGYIYQLSNLTAVANNDMEIIINVSNQMKKICQLEFQQRKLLFSNNKNIIFDTVSKSLAILKSAFILSYEELMENLAIILTAVSLNIINNSYLKRIKNCYKNVAKYSIEYFNNKKLSDDEYELLLAKKIKNTLKGINLNEL